jgi:sugar phosphate permease
LKKLSERALPFHYAWVVLGMVFLAQFASFGIRASFGAYVTPWETDFAVSRTAVTSISTLNFVLFAFAQPLMGKLNDQFGGRKIPTISVILVAASVILSSFSAHIWQLYLFFGIMFAFGVAGCSNVTGTAIISRWFKEKRGLAIGISSSGNAVGQLVIVPVTMYLIEQYSWRAAMTVIGIAILVIAFPLISIFIRNNPKELGMNAYGAEEQDQSDDCYVVERSLEKKPAIIEVIKKKEFWYLFIPYSLCGFTDVGLINTHFIPFAQGKGFDTSIIALTFSIIAAFNILGTIVTGLLSDRLNRGLQLALIYMVRCLMFIFLLTIQNPKLLIIFAIFYGSTEMATIAPTNSLTVSIFSEYSIGAVIGLVAISHQIGGALGSWIPGLVYDLTGSYYPIFIFSIGLLVVAAVISSRLRDPDHLPAKQN